MPEKKESKYAVQLKMVATKNDEVINENDISWDGLGYDGLVLIQKCMLDSLVELNQVGMQNAVAKGCSPVIGQIMGKA